MKYIKKKYIDEIVISELDIENLESLGLNYDDDYGLIEEGDSDWGGEATPIPIDEVIDHLEHLKKQGANYVEITHNCDHYGYTFNGLEIRLATKEETDREIQQDEDHESAKKASKIKVLEAQIAKLKE